MISLNSPSNNYPLSSRENKSPYSYKTQNFFQDTSTNLSIHSLEDQKMVVGTKLSKLEMRIKQLREAEKSKQDKLLARNLVEELLSIHEVKESFDVKRSLKDLVEISNKNELSINKLQSSLKNSSLNPALKMSTTKKIQHLLEEIQKSKDIEQRLVGVLKKNENEQQELKSIIIDSTIEKNLNDSLVFEHKTLQLEKEMIQLRISNLEIQREKDLQIERVKLELKETKLQLQKALSEICEFKTSKIKHRDNEPLENNFLTPKSSTKYIANTTKPTTTTAHKQKAEQAPSFRFLAKNFETSKTPNSKYEEKSDNETTSALKKTSKSKTLTLDTNDQIKLPNNHPLKDILRPHRENSNPDALRLLPPQINLTSKSKSPIARVTKNELSKIISPKNVELPSETIAGHHARQKNNHSMDQNSNFESHNRRESYKLNDRKLPEKSKTSLTPTPKNFDRTCPPQILTQKTPTDHSYYKYKTLNPDFEKKSPYSTKMRANPMEDNDTCLIGSVTQVDFENQVSDHLATNLLKDISNTTRPVPEIDQFNFKLFENKGMPSSSDKENRNYRFLEDSDKKNPLEMEFED